MTNLTIGMDLGDRYTQLCVLDGDGTEIESTLGKAVGFSW
jgi:hypothetical protein